jgi:hypothetical protein
MNIEKFREYFSKQTYTTRYNGEYKYTISAMDTRIFNLKTLELALSIDIDDIIKDDNLVLELLLKTQCNMILNKDGSEYFDAPFANAIRHYYKAINGKSYPLVSDKYKVVNGFSERDKAFHIIDSFYNNSKE